MSALDAVDKGIALDDRTLEQLHALAGEKAGHDYEVKTAAYIYAIGRHSEVS